MSDKYAVPNKLPSKQVAVLAHRRKRILKTQSVFNQRRHQRIANFARKPRTLKRAEAFIMSEIKAKRANKRIKHIILNKSIMDNDKTSEKLLVVMRHAGKKMHDETTTNVLNTLRLYRRYNAVFLKNSTENQILLKVIEPFVIYGYPTISTIRELIFKQGFCIVDGNKVPIQSNTIIEEQLGTHGVICIEDIIHDIFSVGENFEVVTKFLSPFMLKAPRTGFTKKTSVPYKRSGEYGNRQGAVNSLIALCM